MLKKTRTDLISKNGYLITAHLNPHEALKDEMKKLNFEKLIATGISEKQLIYGLQT